MASDLSTVAFIYKHNYSDKQIENLTTRDHVQYAMIEREDGFVGADFPYVIRSGNPQGIGGTFAGAQAAAETSKGLQFTALRKAKFGDIVIDGEALKAARGNKGAFFDLVTMETENILIEMGDSLAFDFYRDTSGVRGKRSSISGNIVTLTVSADARNFKEAMTVMASPNADGSSPRTGTTKVLGIDEVTGNVTLVSAAAISGFADGDFLFRSTDPGTCIEGLEVCTPLVAPTAGDSFRGKDRSTNVTRYAGSRVNDTSTTIEENLGLCAVYISRAGRSHNVDQGFLEPTKFWEVSRRLNAQVLYEGAGGTAEYGFQYINIVTPSGSVKVYSDPDCQTTRGRLSKKGTQYIKTMDAYPHINNDDGNYSLRQAAANAIEARAMCWGNLIQTDPVAQGVIAI